MSPGKDSEELSILRAKLAEAEAELLRRKGQEREGEVQFRLLTDIAPFMIWMCGSDAFRTYFNKAWLDFRGRALEDELGNGWIEGVQPDDRDHCMETYLKSFGLRQPYHVQYRLQRSSGEYSWIEETGVPRFHAGGEFAGFVGVAHDLADRRRAAFRPDEDAVRLVFALTERERQVLVLIAAGKSTKEAAAALGISYKTADSHRSRILEKLGVHETASMVRYAIRAGLIEA
jgi:PAS domain S-box-containing protein